MKTTAVTDGGLSLGTYSVTETSNFNRTYICNDTVTGYRGICGNGLLSKSANDSFWILRLDSDAAGDDSNSPAKLSLRPFEAQNVDYAA